MAQGLTCLDQPVGSVWPGGTEHLTRRRSGAGPGRERDARAAQLAGQRFGAPKRKIFGTGRAALLVPQHRREGLIARSPAFLTCAEHLGEAAEIDCCGGQQPSDPGLLVPSAALVCHAQHADLQPAAGQSEQHGPKRGDGRCIRPALQQGPGVLKARRRTARP